MSSAILTLASSSLISTHSKTVKKLLVRLGWSMKRVTTLVTIKFLLKFLNQSCFVKYRIVHTTKETKNKKIGRIPERKSFRKVGDGVNKVKSCPFTKQSKETNGDEDELILEAGENISPKLSG